MKKYLLIFVGIIVGVCLSGGVWGQTTVSYDFLDGGAVTGLDKASPGITLDANIGFGSFKNSATNPPAIFSGQLRLYQNATKGGSIKIYAKNGVTITKVVVNASGTTGPAAFTVDGGSATNLSAGTTYTMSSLSATSVVEFYQKNASTRIYVDKIEVTYTTASSGPTITLSETNLAGFTYVAGSGPSTTQTFTVAGSNLTGDISIAATTNYEISKTSGSGYATPLTFTQSGGSVASTTVYVRLKAGLAVGDYNSENITAASTGATNKTVACSGSVTCPSVSAPTATAGTTITGTSFLANWGAVSGASGYELDVYQSGSALVETFTAIGGGTTSSYLDRTWTGDGGTVWTAYKIRTDQVVNTGNDAITLKDEAGAYLISDAISGSISSIEFDVKQVFTGSGGVLTVTVLHGVGFATVLPVGTISYNANASQFSGLVSGVTGDYKIKIENNTSARPAIDNLSYGSSTSYVSGYQSLNVGNVTTYSVTGLTTDETYFYVVRAYNNCGNESANSNEIEVTTVGSPGITVSPTTLTGFTYVEGLGPSSNKTFTISGSNLTGSGNITVTGSSSYEVSTDGTTFSASVTYPFASGEITGQPKTVYVRLKAGLSAATYNENISYAGGGVTSTNFACSGIVYDNADWCNLQWPATQTITSGQSFDIYARIYEAGLTTNSGAQAGITCEIGYSASNSDPSTWTSWSAASFNTEDGNNDEYKASIGSNLASGTYYYASRFSLNSGTTWSYGGYNTDGGSFWNGTTYISGVLTVNSNSADWCNLQWPASGAINAGGEFLVYARVYELGLTNAVGQGAGVTAWIGYSTSNTNPNTWSSWIAASYNVDAGDNDEYKADLGSSLPVGTYYYASRFRVDPNNEVYSYGGYNDPDGGIWDGTTNVNGVLTVSLPAGACSSDLIISEYGEGSSNNKYIEIYNGTGTSVDLSNYILKQSNDGTGWDSDVNSVYNKPLSGTLANEDVFVIAASNASATILAKTDLQITYSTSAQGGKVIFFTGNDAMGLFNGTTLIDVFGDHSSSSTIQVAGSAMGDNHTIVRKETIFDGNTNWTTSSGTDAASSEWIVYANDTWTYLGSHDMEFCGPTITLAPLTLTGFTYVLANGPSAEQTFTVIGTNLTADISIAAPTNYEISTTTGGSFVATNPITLTQSGGIVASTTIYVRLKAGLAAGSYNTENITATSTDAADKTVTCSGIVTTPTLSVSTTALTGFDYIFGNGPSTSQSFTVSGTYLTTDLVVTAPADYEVSTVAGSGYGATVSLTPASNTVATTTIYVRLKSGKAIGTYNLQNIVISSTGATSANLACSGKVTLAPATNLAVGCTGNASAVITWTAPVGTYEGVVIAFRDDDSNPPHTISDGTDPSTISASSTFMSGTEFGSTTLHSFVVFKGTGTTVTVTGLTASETYKVKAYTYSSTNWLLNTDCPTVTVSNLGLNEVTLANNTDSDAQSELIWTNPATCVDEILVVCKHGSAVTANPSGDGTAYTANAAFGSGTDIGTSEYVVYKGTAGTVTITGLTNDETYYATIFTRKGTEWSTGVGLILYPASVTILEYGDLAIVAVNTGQAGGDEISFVSFRSIATNTSIDFTDNGYERATAGKWGDSEGTIRITRTGSNVPAGSVITIVGDDGGATPALGTDFNIYLDGSVDNTNWTLASLNGSSPFNMNSTDQVWIMQGGNWTNPGGSHDATYSGNVLFGWTAIGWEEAPGYGDTKGSTIYPGCECATTNVLGKVNEDKVKYTGATTAANRTEWIGRINDPENWTDYTSNALFDAGSPAYREDGATFTITAGSLTAGKWAGYKNSGWCNCANWFSLKVPDNTINVEIPAHNASYFDLKLSAHADSLAYCNSLTVIGDVYNDNGAKITIDENLDLTGGHLYFDTNAIDVLVGGDITIDEADNFETSKANFTLNGTTSQTFNVEGATLETIQLNSLKLTSGGTKTIADNLKITTDLSVDNSILGFSTLGSSLTIDGNITLQNAATMDNNCKSNLDIILSNVTSQTLRGSGNAIKALSINADKTNANLTLSSTGGRTDLFMGSLGDFNMTGTSVFTDNANIIQTDDDLYLGGDGSSNYSLTGIVRFTGANVTGGMILSDDDGSSVIAAELYTLEVTGGDLDVYPTTGGQTIIVNSDFSIEGTSTASANSNDFEIGGDYYVNSDAAFDADNIIITLNGTTDQNIDANSSQETFAALIIDKPSGNVNLSDNIDVDDLSLTSGLINTGANRVYVTNPAVINISSHTAASYINGNLRRAVNTTGSYDLPVGNATNYELAKINFNSATGITYLDASFNALGGGLDISGLGLLVNGTLLQTLLDGGFWTLTPNVGTSAVNYNVGLNLVGSTNAGTNPEQHTIVKRDNSSSDWGLYGSHSNATQTIGSGIVYAYRSNVTSFSDHAIAKNNLNPLPVELLFFSAKCDNNITELAWETASETNNDYFDVQKSDNGYLWNNIGIVKGAGNSNVLNSYVFADKVNSATAYYRLRQVDYDGKFEYSPIIVSNCDGSENIEIITYPNPVTDILNISIGNWKAEKIDWEIVNVTGQTVLNGEIYSSESFAVEQIDISSFKTGMYLIRFSDNSKTFVRKIDKK